MASSTISSARQYHTTSSAYVLPNDVVEHERLDAQAAAIVEMIGGNAFLAPLNSRKVFKAVDVGCGTGVATVQLASLLPSAVVHGLDISPVPTGVADIAPRNVRWAQGNILDVDQTDATATAAASASDPSSLEIFRPAGLDYIFGRMLFLGINDWPRYFSVAARALKPGAVIEHQDLDWKFYRVGTSECLSDGWEWHREVVAAAAQSGLSTQAGSEAAALMEKAGLEVVSTRAFEFSFVPSRQTPNSQAMGRYVRAKLVPQYPELLRKMLSAKVTPERLEKLIRDCLRDIGSEAGVHQKYTVTIARKP